VESLVSSPAYVN